MRVRWEETPPEPAQKGCVLVRPGPVVGAGSAEPGRFSRLLAGAGASQGIVWAVGLFADGVSWARL